MQNTRRVKKISIPLLFALSVWARLNKVFHLGVIGDEERIGAVLTIELLREELDPGVVAEKVDLPVFFLQLIEQYYKTSFCCNCQHSKLQRGSNRCINGDHRTYWHPQICYIKALSTYG